MIAANGVTARFLTSHGWASIRRVVRAPKRWPRIVEIAATHGTTLPDAPDARALEQFLTRRGGRRTRKRSATCRSASSSCSAAGEYVAEAPGAAGGESRRALRAGRVQLHALDRTEPAFSRPGDAAAGQGRARRPGATPYDLPSWSRSPSTAPGRKMPRPRSNGASASRPRHSGCPTGSARSSARSSPARPTRAPGSGSTGRRSKASSIAASRDSTSATACRSAWCATDAEKGFVDFVRI